MAFANVLLAQASLHTELNEWILFILSFTNEHTGSVQSKATLKTTRLSSLPLTNQAHYQYLVLVRALFQNHRLADNRHHPDIIPPFWWCVMPKNLLKNKQNITTNYMHVEVLYKKHYTTSDIRDLHRTRSGGNWVQNKQIREAIVHHILLQHRSGDSFKVEHFNVDRRNKTENDLKLRIRYTTINNNQSLNHIPLSTSPSAPGPLSPSQRSFRAIVLVLKRINTKHDDGLEELDLFDGLLHKGSLKTVPTLKHSKMTDINRITFTWIKNYIFFS